jgi:hypothetical protein
MDKISSDDGYRAVGKTYGNLREVVERSES